MADEQSNNSIWKELLSQIPGSAKGFAAILAGITFSGVVFNLLVSFSVGFRIGGYSAISDDLSSGLAPLVPALATILEYAIIAIVGFLIFLSFRNLRWLLFSLPRIDAKRSQAREGLSRRQEDRSSAQSEPGAGEQMWQAASSKRRRNSRSRRVLGRANRRTVSHAVRRLQAIWLMQRWNVPLVPVIYFAIAFIIVVAKAQAYREELNSYACASLYPLPATEQSGTYSCIPESAGQVIESEREIVSRPAGNTTIAILDLVKSALGDRNGGITLFQNRIADLLRPVNSLMLHPKLVLVRTDPEEDATHPMILIADTSDRLVLYDFIGDQNLADGLLTRS